MGRSTKRSKLKFGMENSSCFDVDTTKSINDRKSYRLIRLENNLRCMLVHDPESFEDDGSDDESDESSDQSHASSGEDENEGVKKSACALAVGVGSFSDPKHCQGLAHYLEHMLFMGSTKFPGENDYGAFISKHGGFSNAYTEAECTVYYFTISPSHFEKALDLFSQFFISPLMNEDSSERELNAIESEFKLHKNNDNFRLQQLRCQDSDPNHPYHNFSWGNIESLKKVPEAEGIDVRNELLRFHRRHYRAPSMQLVIIGSDSLDELESQAKKYFIEIKDDDPIDDPSPANSYFGHEVINLTADSKPCRYYSFKEFGSPLQREEKPCLNRSRPIGDRHRLCIAWSLPPQSKHYRSKAESYVAHMIGHEGKGSLLSLLREKHWATELCAGIDGSGHSSGTYGSLFEVKISLTKRGVSAWTEVVRHLFQLICMIKREGVLEWIHNEMRDIAEAEFRFQEEKEPEDLADELLCNMMPYLGVNEEHILVKPFIMDEWKPDLVRDILDELTPSLARYDMQSSIFGRAPDCNESEVQDQNAGKKEVEDMASPLSEKPTAEPFLEKRFGVEFWKDEVPKEIVGAWEAAFEGRGAKMNSLTLPEKNIFIPTDFSMRSGCLQCLSFKTIEEGHLMGIKVPASLPSFPKVVMEVEGVKIWHLQDTKYNHPRSDVRLKISCPDPSLISTECYLCLLDLMVNIIVEHLTEITYMADSANLQYRLKARSYGLELHLWGFNHKMVNLLKVIVIAILEIGRDGYPSPKTFETQKETLLRCYSNELLKPSRHSTQLRLCILYNKGFLATEKAAELKLVTMADFIAFLNTHLAVNRLNFEVFITGNVTEEESVTMGKEIIAITKGREGSVIRDDGRSRLIPCSVHFIHCTEATDPAQFNSSVEAYWQVGEDSIEKRTILDIAECLMDDPLFDSLRTRQQLAYSVGCGVRNTSGVLGFCIKIVSCSHSPSEVLKRIEEFTKEFMNLVKNMSNEEYREHIVSLAKNKLEPDRALHEQADRNWVEIATQRHDFNSISNEVHKINAVEKNSIVSFLEQLFDQKISKRLTVFVCGKDRNRLEEIQAVRSRMNITALENIKTSREHAEYYPVLIADN